MALDATVRGDGHAALDGSSPDGSIVGSCASLILPRFSALARSFAVPGFTMIEPVQLPPLRATTETSPFTSGRRICTSRVCNCHARIAHARVSFFERGERRIATPACSHGENRDARGIAKRARPRMC